VLQSLPQSSGMILFTQYMIVNSAFLNTCFEAHARTYALYQPTHGITRRDRPRTNYIDYIHKLTGLKIN